MDETKDQSTERSGDHDDDESIQEQPDLSDSSRILHHHDHEKDNAEDDNPNPSDEVDPVVSSDNPPSEEHNRDENPEMMYADEAGHQEESDHHHQESIQEHGGNEGNNKDLNDEENKSDSDDDDDDSNLHSVNKNTDDLNDKEEDRDENPDEEEEEEAGHKSDNQEPAGGNEGEVAAQRFDYRVECRAVINYSRSLWNFLTDRDRQLHIENQSLYIKFKRKYCNNNNNNNRDQHRQKKILLHIEEAMEILRRAFDRCFEVHNAIIEGRINILQIEQHFMDIELCCIELIFGEVGVQIMEALRKNPTMALPVIMKCLKQEYEQCCECRSLGYSRYHFRRINFVFIIKHALD